MLTSGVFGPHQNVANLKAVQETALAAMSETPLPSVVNQILDEKKLDDPELVADATTLKTSLEANLRVLTCVCSSCVCLPLLCVVVDVLCALLQLDGALRA